jgi:integrase
MTRRSHGDGGIDQRSANSYRLRYRLNGKRYSQSFHGTLTDAKKKLRELIRSGDTGGHVAPDRITVAQWIEHWFEHKKVGRRAHERYAGLLRDHAVPVLGDRRLQALQPIEIDGLYAGIKSAATHKYLHIVFKACLSAAVRKGLIVANPMDRIDRTPGASDGDHGVALEPEELTRLLTAFRNHPLSFPHGLAPAVGKSWHCVGPISIRWRRPCA